MNLPVPSGPGAGGRDGPDDDGPDDANRPGPGHLPPAVAHLFRRSLRQGQVHPLLPLLLRYRRRHPAEGAP